jgi:hypothetical protein
MYDNNIDPRSYELPYIASTVVVPLLKAEMDKWNVLDEPRRFREEFNTWRDLLMMMPQSMASATKRPEPGTQVGIGCFCFSTPNAYPIIGIPR